MRKALTLCGLWPSIIAIFDVSASQFLEKKQHISILLHKYNKIDEFLLFWLQIGPVMR